MSYGLKIFNWVEDAEKEVGGVRSFYETKEVLERRFNEERSKLG